MELLSCSGCIIGSASLLATDSDPDSEVEVEDGDFSAAASALLSVDSEAGSTFVGLSFSFCNTQGTQ